MIEIGLGSQIVENIRTTKDLRIRNKGHSRWSADEARDWGLRKLTVEDLRARREGVAEECKGERVWKQLWHMNGP